MSAAVSLRPPPVAATLTAEDTWARDFAIVADLASEPYRHAPGYAAIVAAGREGLRCAARTFDARRGVTELRWSWRWVNVLVRRAARNAGGSS